MNETPTLKDIKNAGYYVNIRHLRAHSVAYKSGDLLEVGVVTVEKEIAESAERHGEGLFALLPKGGRTEVEVYDPETKAKFWADAVCHPDDHYIRAEGIKECLKKISGLMLVCDGTDGFRCRLQ
jgi:hypothetical protein